MTLPGRGRPSGPRQRRGTDECWEVLVLSECPGALRLPRPTPGPGALLQEGRVLRYILIIVYLAVGVFIANSHHYFVHLNSLTAVLSALLAVVLWPLILVGVNLHIK